MGSIAIDRLGNIGLGYSYTDRTTPPSIRYATRLVTDLPGTLRAEMELQRGKGVQTGHSGWGDYSTMSVDPVDGCTFWYTQEYYAETGTDWRTRVGSFRLPECSGTPVSVTLVVGESPVRFGNETVLSGQVSSGRANETVTIWARRYDETGFAQVRSAATDVRGNWSATVRPKMRTMYLAGLDEVQSEELAVRVRPRIRFRSLERSFSVQVLGARSFAERTVVLQRRTQAGSWLAVSRHRLGRRSSRVFPVPRQPATAMYRIYMSASEAGPGYLASWSETQTVMRRS